MIAAPFLGEFGWEVSLWVPWLRWMMSKHYQGRDLTVICRAGHEYLYEDFTDKTFTFAVGKPIDKVDCQNVWIEGHRLNKKDYQTMAAVTMQMKVTPRDTITPMDLQVHWSGDEPPHLKQGEYRPYGSREKQEGWVAVHARLAGQNQGRNWPSYKWGQLMSVIDPGHTISVGTKGAALHVEGTEDLRGLSLKEVCDAISRCQLIVGPSSGPLALAMLCGTPVVWWSPNPKDVSRFKKHWNPFHVEQSRASASWDPDVIEVEAACQGFL